MRVKPRIARRSDGRWVVRKPPIGFRPTPDETEHDNWRDAVGSLIDMSRQYVAGGSAERRPVEDMTSVHISIRG